ncbi:MAG: B12-binding domain-containing radical SAM protein [Promethearchaeota archaeon]
MKASIIFPNIYLGNYLNISVPIHPPLSLAYLGAVLRQNGVGVQLIDASAENLSFKKLIRRLRDFDPDVIGITTNISCSQKAVLTARVLKTNFPSKKFVMGGAWATVEYEMLLKKKIVDAVVIGEGEYTFLELCNNIHEETRWREIDGLAFSTNGENVIKTKPRALIEDLDALPFPAWDLLPKSKKYHFIHRRSPFYPIMTTRGCPFDCIHCTKVIHGYKFRTRSVQNVIDEIRYLVQKFNTKEIFIIDDSFNLIPERAESILDEIIKNRFNLLIKFTNGIRADRISPRFGLKLRLAGTYAASLGIESGCQDIVNKIGKKLDLKSVRKAVGILRANHMIIGGFFILGHPYDSFRTMLQTINFAISLDLDYPQFFKSLPFPGTKMYDIIKENGEFLDDGRAKEGYVINKVNFKIWDLNPDEIEKAFIRSYRAFYLRPRKLFHLMTQYRSLTEFWWLIKSAISVFLKNLF